MNEMVVGVLQLHAEITLYWNHVAVKTSFHQVQCRERKANLSFLRYKIL